jgi:hypothetical protein
MGFIREPDGVDLMVYPSRWTEEDFALISKVIAHHKKTGKFLKIEPQKRVRKKKSVPEMVLIAPLRIQEVPNSII